MTNREPAAPARIKKPVVNPVAVSKESVAAPAAPAKNHRSHSAPVAVSLAKQSSRVKRWQLICMLVALGVAAGVGGTWAIVSKLTAKAVVPTFQLSAEENELFGLTNQARASSNLPALKVDRALCQVAKTISTARAEGSNQFRISKNGLEQQLRAGGYTFKTFGLSGINVKEIQPVTGAFTILSADPAAQGRVMDPAFEDIGVSIVYSPNQGMYFVTQVFAVKNK